MAYQQFYGNPYSPAVGGGIMAKSKQRADFARSVQRARIRAAQRRMSLAEAKFEWQKEQSVLVREMEQRRFDATLALKRQGLQKERLAEEQQQQRWEQEHGLRREQHGLNVRKVEEANERYRRAEEREAELDRLGGLGEIEEQERKRMEDAIQKEKDIGNQLIGTINAGAVPVAEDYEMQPGEVEFRNPFLGKRFVIRPPSAAGAEKYTPYQKQSIRQLNDEIDSHKVLRQTYREEAERLEQAAAQAEAYNEPERAKEMRKQAKKYKDNMNQIQDELASLHTKRREMVEGVLEPERRKMEQYEPDPRGSKTAMSAPEMIQEMYRKAKAQLPPDEAEALTIDEIIESLEKANYIRKRAGRN